MRLTCEYELDILSNTKVGHAKVHSENYMKLRPLLACHLLCNHLLRAIFENFEISTLSNKRRFKNVKNLKSTLGAN